MQLKLVCLNLWQGGNLFPQIFQFLKEQRPDIMCFQEVYDNTQPEQPDLPQNYRSIEKLQQAYLDFSYRFALAFLEKKPGGLIRSGNAVFSRFPIMAEKVVFFDRPF